MKRIIFSALAVILCLPMAVYAAGIGGAETQGKDKFSISLDQEFIFDKDIKDISEDWTEGTLVVTGKDTPEVDSMNRTMVKASYGMLDNVDVYVKLGTADADFKMKGSGTWVDGVDTGTWNGTVKMEGDNAFAYGFGAKGTYNLNDDWIIGCEAQYLRHKNDVEGTTTLNVYDNAGILIGSETSDPWKGEITIQEWQIAPYVAKRLGSFIPYLGVKYSDESGKYKDEDSEEKFEADDNFGMFLGTDYKMGENWKVNLEGRFIDETAMSFGATYKF